MDPAATATETAYALEAMRAFGPVLAIKLYRISLDEPPALRWPGRQEYPVDGVYEPDKAVRDVAHVDDAVVSEYRGMAAWILEEQRVGEKGLERGLRLDRPPEMILEVCAEVAWEVLVKPCPPTLLLHRGNIAVRFGRPPQDAARNN